MDREPPPTFNYGWDTFSQGGEFRLRRVGLTITGSACVAAVSVAMAASS